MPWFLRTESPFEPEVRQRQVCVLWARIPVLAVLLTALARNDLAAGRSDDGSVLQAGVAQRDITPERPVPMWGYGARRDRLSEGVHDRLRAGALVIEAAGEKTAVVALDLGRGPTPAMMRRIRALVSGRGIRSVLICGSHTHHGPVLELTDAPERGQGKFDAAVDYARTLPELIAAAILEADDRRVPVRIGVGSRPLGWNRNRHSRRPQPPVDPKLTVLRVERLDRSPLAILVHFAAHPVLTPAETLQFSADYPGFLRERIERELQATCLFLQGAAGDLSANPPGPGRDARSFGERLAEQALQITAEIEAEAPQRPRIDATIDRIRFPSRIQFQNPITFLLYSRAFFPELIRNFFDEFAAGMEAELTTVVINRSIALVGVPGEPFCRHALRLRERANLPCVLVLGYCNGHLLYFPTIEAAAEGGYGADARVAPVALGAGERLMDLALIRIFQSLGKLSPQEAIAPLEAPANSSPSQERPAPQSQRPLPDPLPTHTPQAVSRQSGSPSPGR